MTLKLLSARTAPLIPFIPRTVPPIVFSRIKFTPARLIPSESHFSAVQLQDLHSSHDSRKVQLKSLLKSHQVSSLCLHPKWNVLKKETDVNVYSVLMSLMIQNNQRDLLVQMFRDHLEGKVQLPRDFFKEIAMPIKHQTAQAENWERFADEILACFPSHRAFLNFASQSKDHHIAIMLAAKWEELPYFEPNSWKERFIESARDTLYLSELHELAWCLHLDLPLEKWAATALSPSLYKNLDGYYRSLKSDTERKKATASLGSIFRRETFTSIKKL